MNQITQALKTHLSQCTMTNNVALRALVQDLFS